VIEHVELNFANVETRPVYLIGDKLIDKIFTTIEEVDILIDYLKLLNKQQQLFHTLMFDALQVEEPPFLCQNI